MEPGIQEQNNSYLLTLPGGGTVNVPQTVGGPSVPATAPPPPQPTTPGAPSNLTPYINEWQDYLFRAAGQRSPLSEGDAEFGLGEIPLNQMISSGMPTAPNLEQSYIEERERMGATTLDREMADLRALEREQQAIRRERLASARGEVSRQDAIEGRVGQIERQEAERMDVINREIGYKRDLIDSINNAINITMQFRQTDFQNAKALWETSVQNSLAVYKQLRGEYEFDKSFEQRQKEREEDMAMANLTYYTKLITEGNIDPNTMSPAQKAEIALLETRAGLPSGFINQIKMAPGANIKEMIPRVDPNTGIKYVDIMYVNPDGSIKIKTQKLGKAELSLAEQKALQAAGRSGGSGTSTAQKNAEQLSADRAGANSKLAAKAGGDGKVSPSTWNIVRNEWLGLGYTNDQFIQFFGGYVNTSHAKDYAGYPVQTQQKTSGAQTGGAKYTAPTTA